MKGAHYSHCPHFVEKKYSNIIHYDSSPLDYFTDYTPLWKLDDELNKIDWNSSSITRISFFEEITDLIINGLKRLNKTKDGDDLYNKLYVYWELSIFDHNICFVNTAVLFKQYNNGTTHLFTHYKKNDFPHDFKGEVWEKYD